MLSVAEAQALVLERAQALAPAAAPLSEALLGRVLAEDVTSDLDMPPFDKALMDGFAVRAADLPAGGGSLKVIEEVTAGKVPRRPVNPGEATRIMTGSPMPAGADAVVMVERTKPGADGRVEIDDPSVRPGRNVLARAAEMRAGETVLAAGTLLRPQEIGVLATVGRGAVQVYPVPRVAVLSTGDEVVAPTERPGPGQIRNGNGPMLDAQVARAGGKPRFLGIARDQLDSLEPLIRRGLRSDVLILSGGVSAGKLDLVPGVLEGLGVAAHFHKVAMKPGKPVFFGTRGAKLVFGLPGNPVSAHVCFELFVRPALRRLAGHAEAGPRLLSARLEEDLRYQSDRPTYHPAVVTAGAEGWSVKPVPWIGSPDLRGLVRANAFVVLPAGDHKHQAGQSFPVLVPESL